MSEEQKEYKYDVALSFAGEDRSYAESLFNVLTGREIKVFYDRNETAQLLGSNLPERLQEKYKNEARYCVMFLSQHYVEKRWTKRERRAALDRGGLQDEYILPIRLDNTSIPGIDEGTGYLNWHEESLDSTANIIIDKLGKQSTLPKFSILYQGDEPEPGRRNWYQLNAQRWIEQYPSGHTSTFIVVDRIAKDNVTGVVVRKSDGNFNRTLVPDGGMEIFIPDRESGEYMLQFRHKCNAKWQEDWKYLAGTITYK